MVEAVLRGIVELFIGLIVRALLEGIDRAWRGSSHVGHTRWS